MKIDWNNAVNEPDAKATDEHGQDNFCFGCGPANPGGLQLSFRIDASDPAAITATAEVELTRMHEGPRGLLHGGIIAALLDESMSKLNKPLRVLAMTRKMKVEYRKPAPICSKLTVRSLHLRREGRKLFHAAELLGADGTVLAQATALFVVVSPPQRDVLLARRSKAST